MFTKGLVCAEVKNWAMIKMLQKGADVSKAATIYLSIYKLAELPVVRFFLPRTKLTDIELNALRRANQLSGESLL